MAADSVGADITDIMAMVGMVEVGTMGAEVGAGTAATMTTSEYILGGCKT